ncbi:hypothetical protein SSX86_029965 [Deinandra increscens subsp. villosa]|uniref:Uncharacterized protein n=1 Tax=Deinandra increscens subsp. villosa TaxID=3103831 RepID=A0AAP0CGP2_9ASTR
MEKDDDLMMDKGSGGFAIVASGGAGGFATVAIGSGGINVPATSGGGLGDKGECQTSSSSSDDNPKEKVEERNEEKLGKKKNEPKKLDDDLKDKVEEAKEKKLGKKNIDQKKLETIDSHISKEPTISTRNPPSKFVKMISKLKPNQRKTIEEIGFGSLLSLKVEKISSILGYWLVRNYDPDENTLDIGSRKINVTAAEAREILGVPMGNIILTEYERPRDDEVLEWFKSQFPAKIAVRTMLPDVTDKIEKQTDNGWEFIVNFLVVFGTVFGNTMRNTTANKRFLHHITRDADIKNLNWCEYIVSCLKREKRLWNGLEPFCGPLSFLAV